MRPLRSDARRTRSRGFTLLEMIVSITLLAILAVVMVPLLQLPMSAHSDASRRADLSAQLDLAVSQMKADLATAVPGSVRVTGAPGGPQYVEFMQTRTVARYRTTSTAPLCPATCTGGANRDRLESGAPDNCAATLGLLSGTPVANADQVVVNPMGAVSPWLGNRSTFQSSTNVSANSSCVRMVTGVFTPSPDNQYLYVASMPVTYVCNPSTGRLTRYWGYAFLAAQPTAFTANVANAPVATNVQSCTFRPPVAVGKSRLLSVSLRFTRGVVGQSTEAADGLFEFIEREVPRQ